MFVVMPKVGKGRELWLVLLGFSLASRPSGFDNARAVPVSSPPSTQWLTTCLADEGFALHINFFVIVAFGFSIKLALRILAAA